MKDILLLAPIVITLATGLLAMLLDLLSSRTASRGYLGYVAAAGFAAAGLAAFLVWRGNPTFTAPWLAGVLHVDAYAMFFSGLVLFAGAAAALFSVHHMDEQGIGGGEFFALLAFSAVGALVFIAATDLVTLFLGLEVMSLAVYVTAAMKRSSAFSTEAGLKYFILGGVGSAFLLFGVAFLYGATGKLNLVEIGRFFVEHDPSQGFLLPGLALALLVVAFGFKVAAVPFHMWTPDVYQGAPTPVTVFMAGAVKAAGFAVMGRLLLTVFQNPSFADMPVNLSSTLLTLSILTMVVGNILGIVQTDVKRILAYSSIAHAGYLLLGMYATRGVAGAPGLAILNGAVPFYMLAYCVATVGAFGVVSLMGSKGAEDMSLDRFAGMGKRHPLLTAILMVCLLSLAGIPPFGGFMAKFFLFKEVLAADVKANLPWVIVAVLNSLVALYYYLRILVFAYFRDPESSEGAPATAIRSVPAWIAAGIAALVSIQIGVFPGRFMQASEAVAAMSVIIARPARPAPAVRPPTAAKVDDTVGRTVGERPASRRTIRSRTAE